LDNGAKLCGLGANAFGETPALSISTEYSLLANWNSDARKAALETGNWKPDTLSG